MNPIQEQILRSALFVPCDTKEDLHRWIKIYLGMDLPNTVVCDNERHHPASNSCPMDLVWEIYSKARQGEDPNFQEILAYAARESGKTLSASIIEILCIIHLERDVVHLAAIEPQAKYCLDYVKKFLSRPILKEFITSVNRRNLTFSKFVGPDNQIISPLQFQALSDSDKGQFTEIKNEFKITVATVEACNGLHSPFMCVTGDAKVTLQNYGPVTIEEVVSDLIGKENVVGEFIKEISSLDYKILSYDIQNKVFSYKKISKVFRRKAETITIEFSLFSKRFANQKNVRKIECTEDHKILVKGSGGPEWVQAKDLKEGMVIFSIFTDGSVTNISRVKQENWVYDFTIEDFHNFVCEDIVIHNCMDELDLVDPAAFMEAKSIPTSTVDRKYPITFMTSTRKYSYGLVQKEMDRAVTEDTRLNIRHWNIIDVTERCPPSRHLPEEPKIPIFVNENYLKAISKEEMEALPEKDKAEYEQYEGFRGCLSNCKMFSACKGRLATKQMSTSPMLKRVDHTQSNLRKVSLEHAKAQYLCWKPSTAGLVFPHFAREKHGVSAQEMAKIATGEDFGKDFDKKQLIELFKSLDADFFTGIDWGFTHNFVAVTGAMLGHILYIVDVIVGGELLLPERIDICQKRIASLKPTIFPDSAYPSDIGSFRKAGFRMIDFNKSVLEGINAVSERLYSIKDQAPTIWFLKDDMGVEFLMKELSLYHWKLDKAGNLLDEPDKIDDDSVDALKYLCQNVQIGKSRFVKIAKDPSLTRVGQNKDPLQSFIKQKIKELTQDDTGSDSGIQGGPGLKFII